MPLSVCFMLLVKLKINSINSDRSDSAFHTRTACNNVVVSVAANPWRLPHVIRIESKLDTVIWRHKVTFMASARASSASIIWNIFCIDWSRIENLIRFKLNFHYGTRMPFLLCPSSPFSCAHWLRHSYCGHSVTWDCTCIKCARVDFPPFCKWIKLVLHKYSFGQSKMGFQPEMNVIGPDALQRQAQAHSSEAF